MGEDIAVIHYDEIWLKGKNRFVFEDRLIDNIKNKTGELIIKKEPGTIIAEINDKEKIKDILTRMPGVANFSLAKKVELDMDSIEKESLDFLKDKEFETFKVEAVRHHKDNKFSSKEINEKIGEAIVKEYGKKVKLKNPELTLKIEISLKDAYISTEHYKGVGGIPTYKKQRVICLLSGGIDSPVSAFLMMKRGCEVVFVHFQNQNQMTGAVQDKVEKLAEQLSKYQQSTKLYIVPFEELQKELIMKTPSTLRMLMYRRFMLRIAAKIAGEEKARFLVVGDSLSQVASQTLDNLQATYEASYKPIFTPLIGLNKDEIRRIGREIGTYEISKLPYGDCCSFFVPKHPELKATQGMLKRNEEQFDIEKLIENAIEKVKVKEWT